jgi:hypothetical protein
VFESVVLRRILGPKREEVTGDWKKLHKEEFHNLYSCYWGEKIREDEMGGTCCMHGEYDKCVKKTLVGEPQEKRILERTNHRWENNV